MADQPRDRAVISFEQAERMAAEPRSDPLGGPRTVEFLTFIGAVAVAVATIALVIRVAFPSDPMFDLFLGSFDNVSGGLVALGGAVIVFGTGYRFADRGGAIGRGAGFALLVGYVLVQAGFGLLLLDLDLGDATPLVVLLPSAAVAVLGWLRLRSVPTQLALFAVAVSAVSALLVLLQIQDYIDPTMLATSTAFGATPDIGGWQGHLAFVALGAAWVWFARTGTLRPRNTAFFLGSAWAVVFGLALYSSADGWMILSGAIALALFITATQWRSSVLAAVGAFAGLALIVQLMLLILDEPTATAFVLWFGIPGLLALGGVWALSSRSTEQSPAPTVD
ncbi:MAG: hypothetical protein WEA29_03300 [Acidimicrobiia bacterium]